MLSHRSLRLWRVNIEGEAVVVDPIDGNAIAGTLRGVFGQEMTTATGLCATCGTHSELATLVVRMGGPGAVARCKYCDSVVLVIVDKRGTTRIDVQGLDALELRA
jgi:hypothetical protein